MKNACCSFLEKQLDSSNCLGIKIFAEQHSCQELFDAAEVFGLKHFEEVVIQEEFMTLSLQQVESLFTCNEIQVCYVFTNDTDKCFFLVVLSKL